MLTKKDFEELARILTPHVINGDLKEPALRTLAAFMAASNPRFDAARWLGACIKHAEAQRAIIGRQEGAE